MGRRYQIPRRVSSRINNAVMVIPVLNIRQRFHCFSKIFIDIINCRSFLWCILNQRFHFFVLQTSLTFILNVLNIRCRLKCGRCLRLFSVAGAVVLLLPQRPGLAFPALPAGWHSSWPCAESLFWHL